MPSAYMICSGWTQSLKGYASFRGRRRAHWQAGCEGASWSWAAPQTWIWSGNDSKEACSKAGWQLHSAVGNEAWENCLPRRPRRWSQRGEEKMLWVMGGGKKGHQAPGPGREGRDGGCRAALFLVCKPNTICSGTRNFPRLLTKRTSIVLRRSGVRDTFIVDADRIKSSNSWSMAASCISLECTRGGGSTAHVPQRDPARRPVGYISSGRCALTSFSCVRTGFPGLPTACCS